MTGEHLPRCHPRLGCILCTKTDEEKARLDFLANCIIEDSERVTIPDSDTKALHAENSLEDLAAIRYDLDRYQHIIDVVKSRSHRKEKPLLDSTEIEYVMKQLADARGAIAYYRKRNSDPSGRW